MEPTLPLTLRLAKMFYWLPAKLVGGGWRADWLWDLVLYAQVCVLLIPLTLFLLRRVWRLGGRRLLLSFTVIIHLGLALSFAASTICPLAFLIQPPYLDPPLSLPETAIVESCYTRERNEDERRPFLQTSSYRDPDAGERLLNPFETITRWLTRRNLLPFWGQISYVGDESLDELFEIENVVHFVHFQDYGQTRALVYEVGSSRSVAVYRETLCQRQKAGWEIVRTREYHATFWNEKPSRESFFVLFLAGACPLLLALISTLAWPLRFRKHPAAPPPIPWLSIALTCAAFAVVLHGIIRAGFQEDRFPSQAFLLSNAIFYTGIAFVLLHDLAIRLCPRCPSRPPESAPP